MRSVNRLSEPRFRCGVVAVTLDQGAVGEDGSWTDSPERDRLRDLDRDLAPTVVAGRG